MPNPDLADHRFPLDGHDDWRSPNINELQSIVDTTRYSPAMDPVFVGTNSSEYWSSTTYENGTAYAWTVNFGSGSIHSTYKDFGGLGDSYVRCVRWGP